MTFLQIRGRWVTFLSVTLLCVALIITTLRLRSSENTVDGLREAVSAQKQAIMVNRDTVTELCRTNAIIRGLLAEAIDLRTFDVASGRLPKRVATRYQMNIDINTGYLEALDQQTACRAVTRP